MKPLPCWDIFQKKSHLACYRRRDLPPLQPILKNNHLIRAGEITTAFGQKLAMGRPPSDAEMAERLKCSPFGC